MNRETLAALAPLLEMPGTASYVDPCGGSVAVLANRHPANLETFNDQADDVVAFFRYLRESAASDKGLRKAIRKVESGPGPKLKGDALRAAAFHRDASIKPGGGRLGVLELIDRLRRAQIECISALRCIRDFDTEATLFYVRCRESARVRRMLSVPLRKAKGKVAVHVSDPVDERWYEGWERHALPDGSALLTNYFPVAKRSFFS